MIDQHIGTHRLGLAGDDLYDALMKAHEGLSSDEGVRLNARLVLLLANAVGDPDRVMAIIRSARTVTPAK